MKRYSLDTAKEKKRLTYNLKEISSEPEKKFEIQKKHIVIGSVVVIIAFVGIMINGYVQTNRAYEQIENEYVNLSMSYVTEDKDIESKDEGMIRRVDFESLTAKEDDIYAWLYIPDTNVDYPILQSGDDKEDDDYWLNHNLDGTSGYPGTIFTERMFGKDFKTFNTVIYGHNMKNQTMFGALHNMANEDYFAAHEFIYVYTEKATYKYQIVCASTISDAHLAVAYNGYKTEEQRQQFLDYIMSNAKCSRGNINTGVYDNYITLSTCTSSDTQRFVVLAKCVDKMINTDYD